MQLKGSAPAASHNLFSEAQFPEFVIWEQPGSGSGGGVQLFYKVANCRHTENFQSVTNISPDNIIAAWENSKNSLQNMSAVNECDDDDFSHHYQTMSLTDDQKVMEQSGYCHLYQDIDSGHSCVDRDDSEEDTSDDYECIEEIKAANKSVSVSDSNDEVDTEWRVLSRLELREIGEDWRIVSTMPRRRDKPSEPSDWGKVKDEASECKHSSIMITNNVNNVAHTECENTAKSFLENVVPKDLSLRSEATDPDIQDSAPNIWLRKQVTFGELS